MRFPRKLFLYEKSFKAKLQLRLLSSPTAQLHLISSCSNGTKLQYKDRILQFDNIFLRDSCSCNKCIHPSNGQKLFATGELDIFISPKSTSLTSSGDLEVHWTDGHLSCYPLKFLLSYGSEQSKKKLRFMDWEPILWDGRLFAEKGLNWTNYHNYMTSDESLYSVLCQLNYYGLAFIREIPDSETAVEDVANRIDRVRDTFYGKTWNVRAVADSKNIAYTNLDLGLHMDLLYFSSPPTFQILHCLRNRVEGGSSYFVDAFKTAQEMKIHYPELFHSLCQNHVSFHYQRDGQHYYHTHPTVQLSPTSNQISCINYSPPFQAPFDVELHTPEFQTFISALKKFTELTERKQEQFEILLEEGVCVIFNNRRVLHARRRFSGSGERWLKGAYLDGDGFLSRYRLLREQLKGI